MNYNNDTICALATPAGGAIAVIRLSGPDSLAIVSRLFSKDLTTAAANTLHYGRLSFRGEELDDVVVSVYRAPHSYTGEEAAEISCHGSAYIIRRILQALIATGARQAEPGEYTRRAFLNGKMDLSQAEAVADLIASSNRVTHQMALSQLNGHFSSELSVLREKLLKMTSLLELELDFSDHEELEFADRTQLRQLAEEIDRHIAHLTHSYEIGNALKKGIAVAIIGHTNVGKSTLLNQLLHDDRAIVSDVDGTTRDSIEGTTQINGVTFRFIDTAGIRETTDRVEQIGIERAWKKLEEARIVLWMIDALPSPDEVAEMKERTAGKPVIIVWNKVDLMDAADEARQWLEKFQKEKGAVHGIMISAKQGLQVAELEQLIYQTADIPEITENTVIVTNARHYTALCRASEAIRRVLDGMDMDLSSDLLADDLHDCIDSLNQIVGQQISSQSVLNNIFQHFCVGK